MNYPRLQLCLMFVTFALAILFRWPFAFQDLGGDEVTYDQLARHILSGEGMTLPSGEATTWRQPGFPMLLAAIYAVDGRNTADARKILVVLSSVTAPLLFWLSLSVLSRTWLAALCSCAWLLSRDSVHLSPQIIGESFTALILLVSLLFVLTGIRRPSSLFVGLGGLGLGYAVLTRGFLLPVILLLPAALYLTRFLTRALCFRLFTAALVLPAMWMWRNHQATGRWTFSAETEQALWSGNNKWARGSWPGEIMQNRNSAQIQYLLSKYPDFFELTEMERADLFLKETLLETISNPIHALWLIPRKICILFLPVSYLGFDIAYCVSVPFIFAGLILLLFDNERRLVGILLSVPISVLVITCAVTFGDPRFRATVDPLLFLAAAYAIGRLSSWVRLTTTIGFYWWNKKSLCHPDLPGSVALCKLPGLEK
jgi:hypothetical protein